MTHLAKIELIGRVGVVNEHIVGNERIVRFNIAVDTVYRGGAGATVHTTWFSCSYCGNMEIVRGLDIHLEGRMVGNSYIDNEGKERQYMEVKVTKIW